MGKKRRSMASRLDEGDRSMHAIFCGAANSLSQLYTHATNQQKLTFQAGERHALDKLHQWILRHEKGSGVTSSDILAYLQDELEYGEDTPIFPGIAQQIHQSQPASMHFTNASSHGSPTVFATCGHAPQPRYLGQTKSIDFTSSLPSPMSHDLPHLVQECSFNQQSVPQVGNAMQISKVNSSNQNDDANSTSPNDSTMDMHPCL